MPTSRGKRRSSRDGSEVVIRSFDELVGLAVSGYDLERSRHFAGLLAEERAKVALAADRLLKTNAIRA
jgi:hypothetical protein